MRKTHNSQLPLTEPWLDLEPAKELRIISQILDSHPKIQELVLQDLQRCGVSCATGAQGLTAEQVLRALVIKQLHQFSYRELTFHLADSLTFRSFCRLGLGGRTPSKSALAAAIKAIRATTLEQINRILVQVAEQQGIETGSKSRIDCTVVESNIHAPTDSSLLWDCVRKLTDLMTSGQQALGPEVIVFHNRTRRAKRRHRQISDARSNKKRRRPYRDLICVTEEVAAMARGVCDVLEAQQGLDPIQDLRLKGLRNEIHHFLALTDRVLDQTRRRVLEGQSVPAAEKVVSIFEEHTDIICKDRRETYYGHKICLTAGASSMALDCLILDGNPADSTLAVRMVERQEEIYGRLPRQVAFDGGFCSRSNLETIRQKGLRDVVFAKRRGIAIHEMAKSAWVYKKLRNFRAGVEGVISFLKRSFGLDRCRWKSLRSFHSYVWSSLIACNLLLMARHLMARA